VLVNQSGLELLGKESSIEQVIGSFNLLKHPPFAMTEASSEISEALTGKVVQFVFEMPVSKPVTKNGSATLKNKNSDSLSLR
ncbi:MAG: hypothetical protein JNN15_16295, partial [Blastocatellia bacterium]|nr:hypothetical protein [Blastocatellia bacterium]